MIRLINELNQKDNEIPNEMLGISIFIHINRGIVYGNNKKIIPKRSISKTWIE